MEVFIASEYQWQAYEGGGGRNIGVATSYEAALDMLKGYIKDYYGREAAKSYLKLFNKGRKTGEHDDFEGWMFQFPCSGGDDWHFRIERWETD